MEDKQQRLNAIKARLGSLSPRVHADLYGAVKRLVEEDLPWLIDTLEAKDPCRLELVTKVTS